MSVIEFGPFSLDRERCELTRRGKPVRLQRKVFDLLAYLVWNRERLVSHEELLAGVWRGTAVSSGSVGRTMALLRRALQDDARRPRWIATVHGRGYRFIGPIRSPEDGTTPARRPSPPATREALEATADRESGSNAYRQLMLGRDAEERVLRQALTKLRAEVGAILLFEGDAGIGKSRLLEWLCDEAARFEVRSVLVRCREDEGAPALLPWMEVLQKLSSDAAAISVLLSPQTNPSLAPLFPELAGDEGGIDDAADPRARRFEAHEALAEVLRKIATRGPLALVFDDLHRADPSSIALLEFLVSRLSSAPILFVASMRPTGSQDATMMRIVRQPSCSTHLLSGLSEADISTLISAARNEACTGALAAEIWRQTDGNPFFVHQLVPFLEPTEPGAPRPIAPRLPLTVRKAVEQTCALLQAESVETLQAAAVIGREFSATLLSEVLDRPVQKVLGAIDDARRARLLLPAPERPLCFRFAHLLVHDVLYDELGGDRRASLHARAAVCLEAAGAAADGRVAELAHHFAASGTPAGTEKAAEYHARAGAQSAARFAHDSAIRHYRSSLALHATLPGPRPEQRFDLLRRLARQTRHAGRADAAGNLWLEAAEEARKCEDETRLVQVALDLSAGFDDSPHRLDLPKTVALLEEAADVETASEVQRARVMARLSQTLELWEQSERAEQVGRAARALAERTGDSHAIADALIPEHVRLRGTSRAEARAALAAQIVRHAQATDQIALALNYLGYGAVDLATLGRFREFDEQIAEFGRLARRARGPESSWAYYKFLTTRALMNGQLARARELSARSVEAAAGGDTQILRFAQGQQLSISFETGRVEDLEASLANLPQGMTWGAGTLWIYDDIGRTDLVEQGIEYAMRGSLPRTRSRDWLTTAALLAHAIASVRKADRAAEVREWLRGFEDLHVMAEGGLLYLGPVGRYVGLLEVTCGAFTIGMDALERTLAECVAIGARLWEARLQLDLATAHAHRGGLSREAARRHARTALELARSLGSVRVERLAQRLLETELQ